MLTEEKGPPPPPEKRPEALYVGDIRHTHSAATFWPGLLDEIREEFSAATGVELSALSTILLEPDLLYPERALERGMDDLRGRNAEQELTKTLAELELTGPPSLVSLRLTAGPTELFTRALPADCVDAETFPFLLCWLLEWAGVPPFLWDNQRVQGGFTGEDRKRGRVYRIAFELENRHVSEGLHQRTVRLEPVVETPR